MKTLVIVAHPNFSESVINKRWAHELANYPDQYTVHNLADAYPDAIYDVEKEQALVEAHGNLVFQFPLFWFSCPAMLKAWFDQVLTHGWAYGRKTGDKLKDRKIALAVSCGIRQRDYRPDGKYRYTLEQVLAPFDLTFRLYCHADYRPFFAFYGEETTPGEDYASTGEAIEKSATDYMRFLASL
jgi:putative NADPH-quinone reductase